MSVAGIDFGNLSLLIAQAGKGGVDVILNDASNRQTATTVSIKGKQRFIGDSGAAMARSNITNTISGMKMLVGRHFDDADVQKELARNPFKAVKMAHGGVGIKIQYNDEDMVVSAEHMLAMMLVKALEISANAAGGVNLADSVLAVPNWFTDSQRRGLLQACEIAQLNCLKVANESACIALGYGIFKSAKKLFSETEPVHIMFIDVGYTGYSVTVVDFIQENMKVLATVCDREVSGRDFDDIIIEFLAESFQKKTGINVRGNQKAILKLQVAAEKAKKTLSPNGVSEAAVNVECLAEDRDLNVVLTREEFESRSASLVARLRLPIERALREANLTREQLSEIEVVGGSSRINIVKKVLGDILGLDASALNYGLKTTMNSDEAVARGAALQAAMLSSRMKVKPFNVVDKVTYGIHVHFDTDGHETHVPLYARGDELPHKPRRITFPNKTSDFSITARYDDEAVTLLPAGESRTIGKFNVRVPKDSAAGSVRVIFNLDKHGLLYVQSAQLMVEMPAEEVKAAEAEEAKTAPADSKEGEVKEEGDKKRYRKVDLEVTVEHLALSREQVKAALELEASMAFEDKLIVETADKRNELESYLYSMRDKLDGALKEFASSAEKEKLSTMMTSAEDWLYGDGFDVTKGEYTRKIEELHAVGNPIEQRLAEQNNRPNAIDALRKQVDMCKQFAANYDEAYAHIAEEDRDRLRREIHAAESWVFDMQGKQGELPLYANPVLTVEAINQRRNALFNVYTPIKNKPKPVPEAKPEVKADEAKGSKPAEGKTEESVPMDQAKGGPETSSDSK